jgi:hypothetical protein
MDEAHNFLAPLPQYKKEYDYLFGAVRATTNVKVVLLTATPIISDMSGVTRLCNLLRTSAQPALPETNAEFSKRYFVGGQFSPDRLEKDLLGYVSFYTAENDHNLFARKLEQPWTVAQVTPDHYKKLRESQKTDLKNLKLEEKDLADITKLLNNDKFRNPGSGYLLHSSETTNIPRAYKKDGHYPAKFMALKTNLERVHGKQMVWSRHAPSGANAIGLFLVKNGWQRISWNRSDHGSNPPKDGTTLARDLQKLRNGEGKFDAKNVAARNELVRRTVRDPLKTFIVLNKDTGGREQAAALLMFNDVAEIKVIIVDKAFSEGISLENTIAVHLFDPATEFQLRRQIIGRAVRMCSHSLVRPADRTVKVFEYIADYVGQPTADSIINNYAMEAGKIVMSVVLATQAASLEAKLNVAKNAAALVRAPPARLSWRWWLSFIIRSRA